MKLTHDQLQLIARTQLSAEELNVMRLLINLEPPDVAAALGVSRQHIHNVKSRAEVKIKQQGWKFDGK